jgi:predicted  nucleic acid-binding Zn-ribbon protein
MNGAALLSLQRLDSELEQLAGRRRRLAEHAALAEATAAQDAWSAEVAGHRRIADEATEAIVRAEADGAALDAKQARLEMQLKTIISPREAEALMSEISGLKARHSDLDDVELEAMERQAEAEVALNSLQLDEERLATAVAEATAARDAALAELAVEEAALLERRAEAAAALDGSELQLYDALRKRHDGVAIASLDGARCSGCHLDLSPAELDTIRHAAGPDLPDCPQCGRLLVL